MTDILESLPYILAPGGHLYTSFLKANSMGKSWRGSSWLRSGLPRVWRCRRTDSVNRARKVLSASLGRSRSRSRSRSMSRMNNKAGG